MQTDAPDPELATDTQAAKCRHCGALADPRAEAMAALAEVREIGLVLLRMLGRQIEARGEAGAAEAEIVESASRSVRRTVALQLHIYEESRKTPEQKHAESLRRIDAQVRAQYRVRKAAIVSTVETAIRAHVAKHGGDAEQLLSDLNERLLDTDIMRVTTKAGFDALCLRICHDLEIVPRDTMLSDVSMYAAIHETKAEIDRVLAARVPPPGASLTAPDPEPYTGGPTKIGRHYFDATGRCVGEDPSAFDPPEEEWHPDMLNRPPVDLFAERLKHRNKPPDTG
jgi:hypothetical protein